MSQDDDNDDDCLIVVLCLPDDDRYTSLLAVRCRRRRRPNEIQKFSVRLGRQQMERLGVEGIPQKTRLNK